MYHLQAESDIEEEMAQMESADEDGDEDERPLAEVGFEVSSSVDNCHVRVTRQAMLPSIGCC